MSWLNFFRKNQVEEKVADSCRLEIPLFPVRGVLFPGGVMSLKIFEQRYLDMAAACMKTDTPFGICLIANGKEIGSAAVPHPIGTLAHISVGDMPQLGILMLTVRGGRRFRIITRRVLSDGLLRAEVELLDEQEGKKIPAGQQSLLPLLKKIAVDLGPEKFPEPHAFNDAAWVGYRLTEIVPVQPLAKQKLLELDNPISRLEILHTYLTQRKVVE